ncbi:MAG: IclR family transcriptional regulator [Candidatus Binatia bacterium]
MPRKGKVGRKRGGSATQLASGGAAHRATVRLLQIQELFSTSPQQAFTLTDLSRRLEIPKSSLLAILRTLTDHEFFELSPTGEYRMAPKAIEMSRDVWLRSPMQSNLLDLAHRELVELERKTGETVFLGVPGSGGSEMIYVDQVESAQLIRYSGGLGERRPLYCTAVGLAYLSALPVEARDAYVQSVNPIPMTPRTVSSREALKMRIDEVQKTGVAVSIEEFAAGASAIGAAIFGRDGKPVGACAVVGPTDRILAQRERVAVAVRAAAEAIATGLGYVPRPRQPTS